MLNWTEKGNIAIFDVGNLHMQVVEMRWSAWYGNMFDGDMINGVAEDFNAAKAECEVASESLLSPSSTLPILVELS
jgi:hypothetical protein